MLLRTGIMLQFGASREKLNAFARLHCSSQKMPVLWGGAEGRFSLVRSEELIHPPTPIGSKFSPVLFMRIAAWVGSSFRFMYP